MQLENYIFQLYVQVATHLYNYFKRKLDINSE